MYAINEGMKQINGVVVDTFSRDVERGGSAFEAEAGTTGFCEEARGYVRITVKDGDFFARVAKDDAGKPEGVEIAVSGCASLISLMESLEFALEALMDGCEESIRDDD